MVYYADSLLSEKVLLLCFGRYIPFAKKNIQEFISIYWIYRWWQKCRGACNICTALKQPLTQIGLLLMKPRKWRNRKRQMMMKNKNKKERTKKTKKNMKNKICCCIACKQVQYTGWFRTKIKLKAKLRTRLVIHFHKGYPSTKKLPCTAESSCIGAHSDIYISMLSKHVFARSPGWYGCAGTSRQRRNWWKNRCKNLEKEGDRSIRIGWDGDQRESKIDRLLRKTTA